MARQHAVAVCEQVEGLSSLPSAVPKKKKIKIKMKYQYISINSSASQGTESLSVSALDYWQKTYAIKSVHGGLGNSSPCGLNSIFCSIFKCFLKERVIKDVEAKGRQDKLHDGLIGGRLQRRHFVSFLI